jgi:hypothetical protein
MMALVVLLNWLTSYIIRAPAAATPVVAVIVVMLVVAGRMMGAMCMAEGMTIPQARSNLQVPRKTMQCVIRFRPSDVQGP